MEVWDDDDLVLPTGPLALHSDASETSKSSASTAVSALFSDHRQDDDIWDVDMDVDETAVKAMAEADCASDEEEKTRTIKGLNPSDSAMKVLSAAPPGKVHLLGTTATVDRSRDWEEDLGIPLDGKLRLGPPALRHKSSFMSYMSDESHEDTGPIKSASNGIVTGGLPTPSNLDAPIARTARSSVASLDSHAETEDDEAMEGDFDLPSTLERVSLSPLVHRQSAARLDRNRGASSDSMPSLSPSKPENARYMRGGGHKQTLSSSTATFSDAEATDAEFFDDLEIPPHFGAVHGLITPPDSVDMRGKGKLAKVDLQSILSSKLQARSEAEASLSRQRQHAEPLEETWEEGLVIDDGRDWVAKPGVVRASSPAVTRGTRRFTHIVPTRSSQHEAEPKKVERMRSVSFATLAERHATFGAQPRTPALTPKRPPMTTGSCALSPPPMMTRNRAVASRHPEPRSTSLARSRSPPRTPSQSSSVAPQPPRSLKYKKSTPHLKPSTSAVPAVPAIKRQRSLASLSDAAAITSPAPRVPSNELQRQSTIRSTSTNTRSYAMPTASSRSRQFSAGTGPLVSITGSPSAPDLGLFGSAPPARPSTPAGPGGAIRITLPTVPRRHIPSASDPSGRSSASIGVRANTPQAAPPRVIRRPKRPRQYGDGTELDGFDDLPTNTENEKRFTSRTASKRTASAPITSSQDKLGGDRRGQDRLKHKSRHESARRPTTALKSKPHLIRNLNASATSKVENGMTWNPVALRWEGNEGALRLFDHIATPAQRPALISQYSIPSPRDIVSPASSTGRAGATTGLGGVRVVGSMIFDPVKMSWFNKDEMGEDELDFGDDEADFGEDANMDTLRLKPKASFIVDRGLVSPRGTSSSLAASTDDERVFWAACVFAQKRHAEEYRPWAGMLERPMPDRSFLWEIRKIISES